MAIQKHYEVIVETVTTRVLHVSAANKGMATIKAKAGAGEIIETSTRVAVKSNVEKELVS